jgi:plasmid stability protein
MEPFQSRFMPVNLSIKNAPDDVVARLKLRAQRNHRSLQGEMLAIIEEAVGVPRALTVEEVMRKVEALGFTTPSESAEIVRSDRDSR